MEKISVVVATFVALCCLHSVSTIREISLQTTQFSLELLKILPHDKNRNVVFSPLGIYSLLAVLQQGSNGSSRIEMDKILHATAEVTRNGLNNVTASIEKSDSLPSLRFMWKSRIKGNHNFTPEFQKVLSRDSMPRFRAEKAWNTKDTNRPSSSIPKGLLSKIVVPSRNSSKMFAALANLLYFNGMWADDSVENKKIIFKPGRGDQIETDGIQLKKHCFIGASPEVGAKWIHLPIGVQKRSVPSQTKGVKPRGNYWSGRSVSLMIMLPIEKHRLDKMVQKLTPPTLLKSFNYSTENDGKILEITIPKFQVNSSANFKPVLKKLGLRNVFGNGTGLSDVSTEQRLFLSKITQRGQFIVDSFGARTSEDTEENFPYLFYTAHEDIQSFTVDEPFLFFVVDRHTLLPLISGKITRPQSYEWNPWDTFQIFESKDYK